MNKKLLGMVSTAFLICIGVIGFQSDVNAVAYDGMEGKTVVNPESNSDIQPKSCCTWFDSTLSI